MTRQQEGHIVVWLQSLGWSVPYKSGWLRGSQGAMATNDSSPRGRGWSKASEAQLTRLSTARLIWKVSQG